MSEWNMPHLKRGWLDSYVAGDEVYLVSQTVGFGISTIDFRKGVILKATKVQVVVALMREEGDGEWVTTAVKKEFRRGVGRSRFDPYRGEGEEYGDRYASGRYRCYPITPEFKKHFEAILEEARIERSTSAMATQLTNVSKRTWVQYGSKKMKALLNELEKIERGEA